MVSTTHKPSPSAPSTDAERTYQITLVTRGAETSFPCRASEFILEAALGYGLDYLPYSCLQGWCVSCAGRLLSGTVDQSASLRFFDADSDEKFDLLCTARPTSDVRIQTHQKETMRQHRIERKLPVPLG